MVGIHWDIEAYVLLNPGLVEYFLVLKTKFTTLQIDRHYDLFMLVPRTNPSFVFVANVFK